MYSLLALLLFVCSTHALPCEHGQKTETICECKTRECNPGQYCNLHMVGGACLSSRKVVYDNVIPDFLHEEMGCDHGLRLSATKPTNFIPISCASVRSTGIDSESFGVDNSEFILQRKHKESVSHSSNGYCELEQRTMLNKFVSDLRSVDIIKDDTFGTEHKTISNDGYCSNPPSERKFTRASISKQELITQCKNFCYSGGFSAFLSEYGDEIEPTCTCMSNVYTGVECVNLDFNWVNSNTHAQHKIERVTGSIIERETDLNLMYLFCPVKTCSSGRIDVPCMCQNNVCQRGTCFNGFCLECDACEFCKTGFNDFRCKCLSQMCDAGNYCSADGQCKLITDPENKVMIRAAYLS